MSDYEKVLEITELDEAKLTDEFKALIHKELALGMTSFVCRHGTLSEAFDKITNSQRYYQAVKESYVRSNEIRRMKAQAKRSQADLLDAQEKLEGAKKESDLLRAKSDLELAELSMFELLVQAEDTKRQLDAFNKIRKELEIEVRAQYPLGIESAELDNWRVVAEYKALKQGATGKIEDLTIVPLPESEKSRLGIELQHSEMAIATVLRAKPIIESLYNNNTTAFLEHKTGLTFDKVAERKIIK